MYNILTLNKISPVGLNTLTDKYTYSDNCENPDGILLRSFKMHDMELPESLLAVARCGAGVNNIPLDKCSKKGIVVFNTPGANANAVKELVLASLFLASRDIIGGSIWAQSLTENVAPAVEKGKSKFVGPEISGKTLGVIGLGAIGVLVANAAVDLGMKVIGYDPFLSVKGAVTLKSAVSYTANLDDIFANSDYITIHVPLNPSTRGMIGSENLAKCKDGVRILNLARGELADNAAIKEAIASGKVAKYLTDFPSDELIGAENVIPLPHLGASTPEAEDNCAVMAASEMMDYIENGNITNSVNFPACSIADNGKDRICVINKNIPASIAAIAGAVADKGINIDNMVNANKGDYAYTLLTLDGKADEATANAIRSIPGVIKVRIINK
ncbi:MAG: 3-phosphoglycerate dehydrogenase family protein [Clostridia bacterium]|nr:3-phosphoglycerate dehydrogenase family protein [Clostridia bacterium]